VVKIMSIKGFFGQHIYQSIRPKNNLVTNLK